MKEVLFGVVLSSKNLVWAPKSRVVWSELLVNWFKTLMKSSWRDVRGTERVVSSVCLPFDEDRSAGAAAVLVVVVVEVREGEREEGEDVVVWCVGGLGGANAIKMGTCKVREGISRIELSNMRLHLLHLMTS